MQEMIGVIGLGIMGGAIARHLAGGGFGVVGFDIDAARCAQAQAAGVTIVKGAAAVAAAAGDVITSLPTPEAALETVEVIARSPGKCRVVVEASTLALADKLKIERTLVGAGCLALDCPLSGTGAQAKVKDLVVYASGDGSEIKRLEKAFLGFARKVVDVGPYGNGSKMKFIANYLVAIHNVASAEAMVLAMKAGLDPRQTIEVVSSGAGTSRVFELRAPMMAANAYLPASMRSSTWMKDLSVIGAFASELDCPTPLFSLAASLHAKVLALGRQEEDTAAVCAVLEGMAGIERKGGTSG
jgi:3-hydroxyisobutyrate dehydrogenase-like beta-hydroxyacid dehydrogenase